jgi:hypothetical protein
LLIRGALVEKADGGIEDEKQPDDRGLDIFSEDQLQNDGDFEQDRHRCQEFAQHQPQWMDGDIGRGIRTTLAQPAARLVACEPYWSLVQVNALPLCDGRAGRPRGYKLNCVPRVCGRGGAAAVIDLNQSASCVRVR